MACMSMQVVVQFEGKETPLHVDPSVTTVGMLLALFCRTVGRSLSPEHALCRDGSGRRMTVRVEALDDKTTLRALEVEEGEKLVCMVWKRGAAVLHVRLTFCEAAVELPARDGVTCGDFAKLVLEKAAVATPPADVVLVKYRPFDPLAARHDDWEVLSAARKMSSYVFVGYQLLCCLQSEFANAESPVRSWLHLLLDWGRYSKEKKALKAKLRAGIPEWARGHTWALLMDANARQMENPGLFASLVAEAPADAALGLSERWESDRRVIFRDVYRTFPTHKYFCKENQDGQLALQHVLVAWHSMEPATGYCLADDHQILTNRGYVGLPQLEQCWKGAVGGFDDGILFATLNSRTHHVEYQSASRMVVNAARADGVVIQFGIEETRWESEDDNASGELCLRVTPEHDMYVQWAGNDSFSKVTAGDLFARGQTDPFATCGLLMFGDGTETRIVSVMLSQLKRVVYSGRTFCVTVPNGLIVARRARLDVKGRLIKSSAAAVVGNCQGLNFIAAIFLLHQEEEVAFWTLHTLLKERGLENMYRASMPLLHAAVDVFQNLIERMLPELASYFAVNDIVMSSFATPWFHTLFSWRFPIPLVSRLFDVVLREGLSVIFRFGLALLKNRQADIVGLDASELLMKLQDVEWLLDGKPDDEWIACTFRIKKTREMGVAEYAASTSTQGHMSLTQRMSITPLLQMAKKMGSNLKILAKQQEYEGSVNSPDAMWRQPDEGLLLVVDENVVAATPEKLVERLTAVRFPGQQFTDAFLLTFRGFLMPLRLAQLLRLRLEHVPRLVGQSKAEWAQEVVEPIHRRVFNLLRLWIASYPRNFDADNLAKEVDAIVSRLAEHSQTMADRIRRTLAARSRPSRPAHPSSVTSVAAVDAAAIAGWGAEELARQLALADWKNYQSVQATHLLNSGASVSAVIRWNARLSCFIEGHVLGSGERDTCLHLLDYYAAVADASLSLNNVSGAIVIVLALNSVMKLFKKDTGLTKTSNQRRWAYLSSLVEMDLAAAEVFLERFPEQEAAIPWLQGFVQTMAVICAEEPDTIALEAQRGGAINFRKCVRLWRTVHVYSQFQKKVLPVAVAASASGADNNGKVLSDLVWGSPDIPLAKLHVLADRISTQAPKWTAPRSPRGGLGGTTETMPTLGRRKSNADQATERTDK